MLGTNAHLAIRKNTLLAPNPEHWLWGFTEAFREVSFQGWPSPSGLCWGLYPEITSLSLAYSPYFILCFPYSSHVLLRKSDFLLRLFLIIICLFLLKVNSVKGSLCECKTVPQCLGIVFVPSWAPDQHFLNGLMIWASLLLWVLGKVLYTWSKDYYYFVLWLRKLKLHKNRVTCVRAGPWIRVSDTPCWIHPQLWHLSARRVPVPSASGTGGLYCGSVPPPPRCLFYF